VYPRYNAPSITSHPSRRLAAPELGCDRSCEAGEMVVLRMGWPIHRRLQEENERLRQREDGDTFNPKTSTPREIALALYGQLTPYRGKAEKVWRALGES